MIKTNIAKLNNDLLDIVKLFYPKNYEEIDIRHVYTEEGGFNINYFFVYDVEYSKKHNFAEYYANNISYRVLKHIVKADLFEILSQINNKAMHWGCLTGIRPVRLYKNAILEYGDKTDDYFTNFYRISQEKLELIKDIAKIQAQIPVPAQNECDLYIGIPFCNGRCSYCSFVSADINKSTGLIEPYTNALVKEITGLKELINLNNIKIRSIYIGGGTPSSLPLKFLKQIFEALSFISCIEYTFEAGRPDTINKELLDLLKLYKINRISINPQTSNDKTLKLIGRSHTFSDVLNAYKLSGKYNFIVNMDLIAGLNGENFDDFKDSLNSTMQLGPENITVHTLCLKKGSITKIDAEKQNRILKKPQKTNDAAVVEQPKIASKVEFVDMDSEVYKMLEYANLALKESGYSPYYLYKQKYSADNLENTGYCKNDKICLYNVDNMDDTASILACGANAISKRVFKESGRIERYANPKDIKTYIEKTETINLMKLKLFD